MTLVRFCSLAVWTMSSCAVGCSEAPAALDGGRAVDAARTGDAYEALDAPTRDDVGTLVDAALDDAAESDAAISVDAFVDPAVDAAIVCPTFGAAVELGHVSIAGLVELSGLVESRVSPGILFAHNDEVMDLYAVRASDGDVRGHWTLRSGGAALGAGDVEDIAMGPMPGGGIGIYLGDIGGGSSTLRIARVAEPVVPLTGVAASGALDAEVMSVSNLFGLAIPNAETLLVNPLDGSVVIVQKDGAAHPCALGPFVAGTVTPDCSAPAIAGIANPSGGDVSADGRFVIIRNEVVSYVWLRPPGGTLVSAFGGLRCAFPTLEHMDECNGEAIGFAADGLGVFTGSEHGGCATTHLHAYSFTP